MEHWYNDAVRVNLKYSEKNLSQCHLAHHESHKGCLGIEPRPLW
jgi:hypothetical protein